MGSSAEVSQRCQGRGGDFGGAVHFGLGVGEADETGLELAGREVHAVVEAVVELLLRNIAGLKNPLLRGGHALLRTRSFRLTNWHAKLTSHHLRRQLHGPVLALLDGYRQQQRSFGESRQALVALINALGAVSYQ